MTCNTCVPFGALTGRVVTGRNTPGENIRPGIPLTDAQRAQRHYQQYGTTDLPPRGTGFGANTIGRLGVPLTDAQRAQRHYQQYGNRNLPVRGTGLGINTAGSLDATNFLQGLVVGGIVVGCISVFVMTATGRGVATAAGKRVQRRIEYGRPKKA